MIFLCPTLKLWEDSLERLLDPESSKTLLIMQSMLMSDIFQLIVSAIFYSQQIFFVTRDFHLTLL